MSVTGTSACRSRGVDLMLGTALPFCVVALVAACGEKTDVKVAAPAPEVKVIVTRAESVPVVNDYVGRVSAYRSVEVQARVQGIVQQRVFTEGTDVKKGDLLYIIDPAEYQKSVDTAEAAMARATADLANATSKAKRLEPLVKEEAISRQDYDDAVTARQQADAAVASARASLESARINLGYTRIYANEAGRIGETQVPEGRLVGKDGPTKMATIEKIDPIYVSFTLSDRDALELRRAIEAGKIKVAGPSPEADRRDLRQGTVPTSNSPTVRVFLPDGSEYQQGGRIDFAGQSVNPDTGTITLRGVLPNPQRELLPGMFVQVQLTVGTRPNAVVIPQQAVVKTPTGHIAWVVAKDGKVERRDLIVGPWFNDAWVIDKGLAPGESVIVDGLQKVQPGMLVKTAPFVSRGATAAMPVPGPPQQTGAGKDAAAKPAGK